MDPHLSLVNALIGLTLGAPPWPRVLGDLSYNLEWLGPSFTLSRSGRTMNPDLVLLREDINHCLVIEAKGGSSLKMRQLEIASQMTAQDLAQSAYVSFASTQPPAFTYVIVCFEAGRDEISARLEDAGLPFAVICLSRDEIRLVRGSINDSELNASLAAGVRLPTGVPFPRQFVPFDNNSRLPEIAAAVIAHVVQAVSSGNSHFQVEDVLNSAIPLWARFHPTERRQMLGACLRVLNRLRQNTEFRHVLRPSGAPNAPNLYTVTLRIPKPGGGKRVVRQETLHNWAEQFMRQIEDAALPPGTPTPDEGTQGYVEWSESAGD